MIEGETAQLIATVLPSDATDKKVIWASSKQSVATVSNTGLVSAIAEGTSTITASAGGKSSTCTVTVSKKVIEVSSVELNKTTLELVEGDSETLIATVKPDDATDKTITWNSSDAAIATVDMNGKVTAIKEGTATVTAKAGDKQASSSVIVAKKVIEVESITLNKEELSLEKGKSETLVATVKPDDATNKSVTWTSSDDGIASVDQSGKVTAIKGGEAIITASAGDKSAKSIVTVTVPVESVSLDRTSITLEEEQSTTLVATVKPDDATDKSIAWSSSSESIVKVDQNGKVTAVKEGTATITAKAGNKEATCKVSVQKKVIAVESVTLDKTSATLEEGQSLTLIATVKPDNATNKTVTWCSSDDAIAAVDQDGKVMGISVGSATITATAGNVSATCTVTVQPKTIAVTSVQVNKTSLDLLVGESETLFATVLPDNATDKTVTWSSDNETVATVSSSGVLNAIAEGSAAITVMTNDGAKTAKCDVTVKSIAKGSGTLTDPYNVAAALDAVKNLSWTAYDQYDKVGPYYVKGKISRIVNNGSFGQSGTYGNASFYISDDGTESNEFYCYRILYLGNKKYTKGTDIQMGDEVVIYAELMNYRGNTPETVANSGYLYSLNGETGGGGGETGTPEGTGTLKDPYNVAAALDAVKDLTWTSTTVYDKVGPYYVKGKISEVTEVFSAQFGNGTFKMVDEGFDADFVAYRVLYLGNKKFKEGDTQIREGDEVIIYAELMNYRGNTPESVQNSGYLYSLNGDTGNGGRGFVAVDLGLPSGIKWASYNVGATKPEEYGDYFAWGETEPKNDFSWETYKWCNGSSNTLTRYCPSGKTDYWGGSGSPDNKTSLADYDYEDDAARAYWGGKWRIPTQEEFEELKANCYSEWTTLNDVKGYKITSKKNGNSIFLPAAGCRGGTSIYNAGFEGFYWSSSLITNTPHYARDQYFFSSAFYMTNNGRYFGFSVRPVTE